MFDDFPELPDFLNRKLNGISTAIPRNIVVREPKVKLVMPRQRLTAEEKQNVVRIFLNNRMPKTTLAPGWNAVVLVKLGRKWVKVRALGKTRCYNIERNVWDKLQKKEAH